MATMTKDEALSIAGSLSEPSKLPGYSYGLPAEECITGSKLVNVEGSTCHNCYALKGMYTTFRYVIKPAQYKRLAGIVHKDWVTAMVTLIKTASHKGNILKTPYFRWHDSGDLQSLDHLKRIALIACELPQVKFWLPTREYGIVKDYLARYRAFPENLIVRLSAHKIDGPMPDIGRLPVSGVHTTETSPETFVCPSRAQGNQCLDCRACWNPEVKTVSYHLH